MEDDLKAIRDFFAHSKPEIYEKERLRDPDNFPEYLNNFVDQNIDHEKMKRGFEYIEQLILTLHNQANNIYQYDSHIGNPLVGPDRVLSGSTTEWQ